MDRGVDRKSRMHSLEKHNRRQVEAEMSRMRSQNITFLIDLLVQLCL